MRALPTERDLRGLTELQRIILLGYLELAAGYAKARGAEIRQAQFGGRFGGVVGVVLIEMRMRGCPLAWYWVVGGLNHRWSHFGVAEADCPSAAMQRYCQLYEQWIQALRRGESIQEIPLAPSAAEELAAGLEAKLLALRKHQLPSFDIDKNDL